jgi:hypothetical protein
MANAELDHGRVIFAGLEDGEGLGSVSLVQGCGDSLHPQYHRRPR